MPAPSLVSSRCADPRRQRGAAVVLALLTVSFAAIVAGAAVADVSHRLEEVSGRVDQAHARELAYGAIDWARNVLADDARSSAVDHAGEPWAIRIPPTPIAQDAADGMIGGHIEDVSGRFDLNSLWTAGRPDADAAGRLARLLVALGESPPDAARAATALGAHLAAQPDQRIGDIAELARIEGFDAALVARMRPFTTALPAPARINVNTAAPEVLAAIVPGLDLDAARAVVAGRERAWFRNAGDFSAALPPVASPPSALLTDVRSRYFRITVLARRGVAVSRLESLVDRQQAWPAIVWTRSP